MGGKKTTTIDTTPQGTQDIQKGVKDYLLNPSGGGIAGRGTAQAPGMPAQVNVAGAQPISTAFNSGVDINRGSVRDVNAGPGVAAQNTQSVDQLGGANSAFFKNMMGQLQPSFTQARTEAMASGREGAGTSTGSGFANILGRSLNRSLGNEQATLANYATQGLQTEVGRQGADASRQLQAGMANQQTGLQAGIANQGADQNFMNSLLTRNAQGLQAQQMGSQAEQFNSGQMASQNALQAQLDAQRNAMGYQGQLAVNQGNAGNFMQLLGQQAQVGAGPTTVQQSGGWGSALGGLAGTAIGAIGGPIGAAAGGAIGKKFFG